MCTCTYSRLFSSVMLTLVQFHCICRSIHRLQHTEHGTDCPWRWSCGSVWCQRRVYQHRQTLLDRGTTTMLNQQHCIIKGFSIWWYKYCIVPVSADLISMHYGNRQRVFLFDPYLWMLIWCRLQGSLYWIPNCKGSSILEKQLPFINPVWSNWFIAIHALLLSNGLSLEFDGQTIIWK